MTGEKISLDLSKDEALVLFGFISRISDDDNFEYQDKSEKFIVWDVESQLEEKISDVLSDQYQEMLERSRQIVCKARDG